jgi:hypothetical protein
MSKAHSGKHRRGEQWRKRMPNPPLLLTTDDRLARIESLLGNIGTRVDHIERLALRIDMQTRKQEPKK